MLASALMNSMNSPGEEQSSDNEGTAIPIPNPRAQDLPPDPPGNPAQNNPSTPEPAPDPLDPFRPENLRLDQSYLEQPAGQKLLTTVPIRKPHNQDFFRVHPNEEYRLTPAALITLHDDSETFLVHRSFVSELAPAEYYLATLYLVMNRQGVLSLWPVKMPAPGQRPIAWHASAAEAASRAERSWIKIIANKNLGAYEVVVANGQLSDPEWPKLSFAEILQIAFRDDRVIQSHSHPVIRRLRGTE
jgi:hypothetical protein